MSQISFLEEKEGKQSFHFKNESGSYSEFSLNREERNHFEVSLSIKKERERGFAVSLSLFYNLKDDELIMK